MSVLLCCIVIDVEKKISKKDWILVFVWNAFLVCFSGFLSGLLFEKQTL